MSRGRRGRRGRPRPLARLTVVFVAFGMVAGAAALTWASGAIQEPASTSAASAQPRVTGNAAADALLARMSLADKLRLLEWATDPGQPQTAVLPGLPHLGVPALHLAQGPLGTAANPAAAMTAPLGVAATFSRADAYANGVIIGWQARALRQQAVARPFGALDTGPAAAAGATFGEDPLLAGGTAAAEIAGIQSQGTMAVDAGLLAGPGNSGVVPSSAALHEIYLQPVEDAVRAGAAGILCPPATAGPSPVTAGTAPAGTGTASAGGASTGTIGASGGTPKPAGPAPCGNPSLLIQILRRELGFSGFVLSGAGANPGTLSLDSGLDGEIAGPGRAARYFTPAALRAAIASKTIDVGTVNQAAGAVLVAMDRFGLLGPAPAHRIPAEPAAAANRVAARTAQDAATLLKNTGSALPLTPAALSSLALIGPGADQVVGADAEGGTAVGIASHQLGTLQVLRQDLAGNPAAHLSFAVGDDMTGTLLPAAALTHQGQPGLVRSSTGRGTTRVVSAVDNTVAGHHALPAGSGHTWTGELTVPETGTYSISLGTGGSWGALTVDGAVVAQDRPGSAPGQGVAPGQGAAPATAAQPAAAASPAASAAGAQPAAAASPALAATPPASSTPPGSSAPPAESTPPGTTPPAGSTPAVSGVPAGSALVPTTDGLDNLRATVTLTAGTHTLVVSEAPDGSGRPVQARLDWVTPAQQQANLAAAVTAARAAKTAVVFAWGNGSPVLPDAQDRLIQDVSAVNPDTIVVLNTPRPVTMPWLGAVRAVLEMWYPGDAGGQATANVLLGRVSPAGRLPVTWPASPRQISRNQLTGIFVGYRRYDRNGLAPLFPFGYGLSFTRFAYSALNWHAAPGGGLTVRFRVTNAGHRTGETVPQVYLGAPANAPPGAAFAQRALAAYIRISLRPGESRTVTLTIPPRQLQYWQDARGWVTAPGPRRLYVGGNERASALAATVTIPG